MSTLEIVIGACAIVASGLLIYFGVKTKTFNKIFSGIGTAVSGLLLLLLGIKSKQLKKVSEENAKLSKINEHTSERMEDVKTVTENIRKKESENVKDEKELPPSGDSASRIDRLNKLHDSKS